MVNFYTYLRFPKADNKTPPTTPANSNKLNEPSSPIFSFLNDLLPTVPLCGIDMYPKQKILLEDKQPETAWGQT